MAVCIQGSNDGGIFFITITCARWHPSSRYLLITGVTKVLKFSLSIIVPSAL